MPRFSVVIPTYGRPALLDEAVSSVLAQTVSDLEVVVVDDASPTPIELPTHPRVRVLRAEHNGGPAAARNLGVHASDCEIVAFLDDDDTWLPRRLEYAEAAVPRAEVAVCWQAASGRMLEGDVHDHILDAMTPHLGATVVRREAWTPMDDSYRACEDVVWWLTVTKRAKVSTEPVQGLVVRRHAGSREGYDAAARVAASLRLLEEHADYFARHRRAAAFRWKRIGLMQRAVGDLAGARRSFLRALTCRPSAADLRHLGASLGPRSVR